MVWGEKNHPAPQVLLVTSCRQERARAVPGPAGMRQDSQGWIPAVHGALCGTLGTARLLAQRCAGSCRVPTALLALARPCSQSFPVSHQTPSFPSPLRGARTAQGVPARGDGPRGGLSGSEQRARCPRLRIHGQSRAQCPWRHPRPSGVSDSCRDSAHGSIPGR